MLILRISYLLFLGYFVITILEVVNIVVICCHINVYMLDIGWFCWYFVHWVFMIFCHSSIRVSNYICNMLWHKCLYTWFTLILRIFYLLIFRIFCLLIYKTFRLLFFRIFLLINFRVGIGVCDSLSHKYHVLIFKIPYLLIFKISCHTSFIYFHIDFKVDNYICNSVSHMICWFLRPQLLKLIIIFRTCKHDKYFIWNVSIFTDLNYCFSIGFDKLYSSRYLVILILNLITVIIYMFVYVTCAYLFFLKCVDFLDLNY